VIAEEKDNPAQLASTGTYWLVDPLDGTRSYVAGGQEFTVNIGLMIKHVPCLGIIYAPVFDDLFYGDPAGVERITARSKTLFEPDSFVKTKAPPRLITSRREAKRLPIETWLNSELISALQPYSSAYKFGLLAAGEADLYPRIGTTCEWDTAAGDAILRAVGGCLVTPEGQPFTYGKPDFLNGDFIACGPTYDTAGLPAFLALLANNKH